jgi:hypothetical protein
MRGAGRKTVGEQLVIDLPPSPKKAKKRVADNWPNPFSVKLLRAMHLLANYRYLT